MVKRPKLTGADVQLTKDHVPVIYHDFLVSETGIDAPVHTLTLEQVSIHLTNSELPYSLTWSSCTLMTAEHLVPRGRLLRKTERNQLKQAIQGATDPCLKE